MSEYPLFKKVLGLVDEVLLQVRQVQSLIIRAYNMPDLIPNDLHPYFADCFNAKFNTSRIEHTSKLNEAEITLIPQIKDQLKQATTLEQQLSMINITNRLIADISMNVIKPSLSFVTENLDCLKSKSRLNIV